MFDGIPSSKREFFNSKKYVAFQQTVIPILKVQRVLGFIPFHTNERGELLWNLELKTTAYGLFAFGMCLAMTLWTQNQIMFRMKTDPRGFKMTLDELLKLFAITPQLFGPLPFFLQRRKFQKFFEKWTSFQKEYEQLTSNRLLLGGKHLGKAGMILMPIVAMLPFIRLFFGKVDTFEFIQAITFSVLFLHQLSNLLYWLLTSQGVRCSARQYREHLLKEVRQTTGYTRTIEEYRLLWISLCKIAGSFASSVRATITLCFIFHVLYLILALYRASIFVPECIHSFKIFKITVILLDSSILFTVIFLYCNVGQHIPKYCTENMFITILEIKKNTTCTVADDARINLFLYTLSVYTPVVSVSGFYEINRSLFGSIVSVLITYMIVIMQLKDNM